MENVFYLVSCDMVYKKKVNAVLKLKLDDVEAKTSQEPAQ